jgi:hypothetical protein
MELPVGDQRVTDRPLARIGDLNGKNMPGQFSYVVTAGIDCHERRRNLLTVLQWLSGWPSLRVIVVEQGATRNLGDGELPGDPLYRFIEDGGPFNKARAMNIGFSLAPHPVVVFGDADMVMPMALIERACVACGRGLDAVNPYRRLVDLDEVATVALDGRNLPADESPSVAGDDRAAYRELLCFAGGVFVIRGAFYEAIGGMDEAFTGWGGEDNAMSSKIRRMTTRRGTAKEGTAFHLWHPRLRPDPDSEIYRANRLRAASYDSMSRDDFIALCGRHREQLAACRSRGEAESAAVDEEAGG